eukprot:6212398-Pleurochrysis_carterae.AAC.2
MQALYQRRWAWRIYATIAATCQPKLGTKQAKAGDKAGQSWRQSRKMAGKKHELEGKQRVRVRARVLRLRACTCSCVEAPCATARARACTCACSHADVLSCACVCIAWRVLACCVRARARSCTPLTCLAARRSSR